MTGPVQIIFAGGYIILMLDTSDWSKNATDHSIEH